MHCLFFTVYWMMHWQRRVLYCLYLWIWWSPPEGNIFKLLLNSLLCLVTSLAISCAKRLHHEDCILLFCILTIKETKVHPFFPMHLFSEGVCSNSLFVTSQRTLIPDWKVFVPSKLCGRDKAGSQHQDFNGTELVLWTGLAHEMNTTKKRDAIKHIN